VHTFVVTDFAEASVRIVEVAKRFDKKLADIKEALDKQTDSSPGERAFVQLLNTSVMVTKELLRDTLRWADNVGACVMKFATVVDSDVFQTREIKACEKLGLDPKKLA
jgi:hypothetical protein